MANEKSNHDIVEDVRSLVARQVEVTDKAWKTADPTNTNDLNNKVIDFKNAAGRRDAVDAFIKIPDGEKMIADLVKAKKRLIELAEIESKSDLSLSEMRDLKKAHDAYDQAYSKIMNAAYDFKLDRPSLVKEYVVEAAESTAQAQLAEEKKAREQEQAKQKPAPAAAGKPAQTQPEKPKSSPPAKKSDEAQPAIPETIIKDRTQQPKSKWDALPEAPKSKWDALPELPKSKWDEVPEDIVKPKDGKIELPNVPTGDELRALMQKKKVLVTNDQPQQNGGDQTVTKGLGDRKAVSGQQPPQPGASMGKTGDALTSWASDLVSRVVEGVKEATAGIVKGLKSAESAPTGKAPSAPQGEVKTTETHR